MRRRGHFVRFPDVRAMAAVAVLAGAVAPAYGETPDAGGTIVEAPFILGAPEATAHVSAAEVQLGRRFTLFVTAVYGGDVRVNLPEPLQLGPHFEVRRSVVADRRRGDGRRVREWQIELVAWELGELAIPGVPVTFTSGGRAAAVATDPAPIRVVGILGDADGARILRGMAGPVEVWQRDWRLPIATGGIAALGLVLVGWRLRRRRVTPRGTQRRPATARARRRALGATAAEALARLDAIEASGQIDRDRKGAYVAMSDVVREYLGQRYGFSPGDQTTADLRRRLGTAGLSAAALVQAMRWLDDCDLVKFGNHHADRAEAHAALDAARALVTTTATAATSPASPPAAEVAGA